MRVLIAEDSESVRFALRLVMEFLGHEVVGQAENGEKAIELYRRTRPEVVLMDVRMPGVDGLTCTSRLSRLDPRAKIVILTGGLTTEREARDVGAAAYVEKPFDVYELGHLIRRVAAA